MTDDSNQQQIKDKIIQALQKAYWMEMETVMNYQANSINLDGILAEEIKKALAADIATELTHSQQLGTRIKVLGGSVPGSVDFKASQTELQPPTDSTDILAVVRGVLAAEESAVEHYNSAIRLCDGIDYVTQDLLIQLLGDEENHRREFRGFLTEFERRTR